MSQNDTAGTGWVFFAAIMMIIVGIFGALEGLAAIIKDGFFVVTPNYYITVSVTTWGWVHLILGIVVALAGFALMSGAMWARIVGILLVGISAIVNFAYIPYYPFWSILIITIDIIVIWALAAHGRALAE